MPLIRQSNKASESNVRRVVRSIYKTENTFKDWACTTLKDLESNEINATLYDLTQRKFKLNVLDDEDLGANTLSLNNNNACKIKATISDLIQYYSNTIGNEDLGIINKIN